MECEYPSTNDIIATPVGGAAIGKVLYRTSDLILDDRSSGGERFDTNLTETFCSRALCRTNLGPRHLSEPESWLNMPHPMILYLMDTVMPMA